MRVLVSADMEGVAGVIHKDETMPSGYDYPRSRKWMTGEANAVVAGILDAEPEAVVAVADAHGPFRNIIAEDLDPRALLVRGRPRVMGMLGDLHGGADAVMFVGYHAKAGDGGGLTHTMNGLIRDVRVNGVSYGEIGLNALMAGAIGAPVLLCSGDDAACAEFAGLVPSGSAVEVKRALGWNATESLSPAAACALLRDSAASAVRGRASVAPLPVPATVALEMDMHPAAVDLVAMIPGVKRVSGSTIRFETDVYEEAYRVMLLAVQLGNST